MKHLIRFLWELVGLATIVLVITTFVYLTTGMCVIRFQ